MKRKLLLLSSIAVLAIAAAAFSACGDDGEGGNGDDRLTVVATIAPVEALARAVAGDRASVRVLAGTGVDPHDFELSPQDRRVLDEADLVIRIGLGIDAFADGVHDRRLLTLSEGLRLREGSAHEEHEDEAHDSEDEEHAEGEYDPHVWHDPENAKLMATAIANRLAELDPANAATFRANAEALNARLDEADRRIRELIESIPPENRKIVTNHDSIGYFLDRYGLAFVGAVIPSQTTSAEPSAGQIAALIDTIKREGVKAIFAESSLDPAVARQVAADTGVTIVDDLYADSLGAPGSGADTIEGMLVANAEKIAAALK